MTPFVTGFMVVVVAFPVSPCLLIGNEAGKVEAGGGWRRVIKRLQFLLNRRSHSTFKF